MIDIREEEKNETAILVGVGLNNAKQEEVDEYLDELGRLVDTANVDVVGRVTQIRRTADDRYYMGKGKLNDIKMLIQETNCTTVIFDDDLSPGQLRNIESFLNIKVIDRTTVILDIFATHARTKESKLQIELAQLKYVFPRLTGMWTHFGKLGGGIGTRGPGETQLEEDKRVVNKKIAYLTDKLKTIEKQRNQQNKSRNNVFKAVLVGYTNVGKSTFLNSLAKSDVLAEDKLFATLDSTTRKVFIPNHGTILLTDTVGFIRKLPHHLVASFKSTLEVINESNLIIFVIDVSLPLLNQIETLDSVLGDLGASDIRSLTIFNKTDLVSTKELNKIKKEYKDAVFVSALKKEGLEEYRNRVLEFAGKKWE